MGIVIDKLLGVPLMHDHGASGGGLTAVSSDPATGTEAQLILNTTDHKIKVWYEGAWQELHSLSSDPTGTDFTFMDDTDFTFMDGTQFQFMNA